MSNGDVVVPPTDLTTATIEAVNLILSQLGISPLDILLGLFGGKPKNEDTNNVIWAYNMSAYWPLHALAANLAMALRNGAPISDSRPEIQQEFGTWKKGTVESIQGFTGVQQGEGGPGFWTLFSLINRSWGASGDGRQAVLQYVKAIDAITIVLAQQTQAAGGGTGGGTGGGETRDNDELGQYGDRIINHLNMILKALGATTGVAGGGGTGGIDQQCCDKAVAAIASITAELNTIASAFWSLKVGLPAPPVNNLSEIATSIAQATGYIKQLADCVCALTPTTGGTTIDLVPLVAAVNSTRDVLATFEKCVCDALAKGTGTDVSGIVEQLQKSNAMMDVPQAIIDRLAAIGLVTPSDAQLAGGGPWAWINTFLHDEWLKWNHPATPEEIKAAEADPLIGPVLRAKLAGTPLPSFKEVLKMSPSVLGDIAGTVIEATMEAMFPVGQSLFQPMIKSMLEVHSKEINSLGHVPPFAEQAVADKLLSEALQFGVAAHWAAIVGEKVVPGKHMGVTAIAALLAELAGFAEISKGIIGPEVTAAISIPHTYAMNWKTRSHIPTAGQAAEMYSRRKITSLQMSDLMGFAGLPDGWIGPLSSIAYRPMSPMMLAAGFANADVDMAKLQDTLEYMGIRPEDLPLAEQAVITRSLQQTRQALVNEAVTAYGQGVVSDDELAQILTDAGYGKSASKLVMQRALIARRITLARESESYLVPEVTQGLITADEGLQALEAAGVQPWQAQLKITLAETRAALTQARKALAAERKLELQRQRNLTRAAIAEYERGTIDEPGLTAALLALGLDATLVATIVAVENAKRAGRLKLVFGQLLTPSAAKLLEDQVAALETQFKKQLIDETTLRAQLAALNVDAPELDALIARWAAARAAATKTGYVLPV